MRIRKLIAVTAALLLTVLAGRGTAEGGVTLRTISCFAGLDGSAEEYVAILQHYESMTGNTVIDNSAVIDEAWKTDVLKDFAAGNEPDILFFFAAGADSAPILSRVVSLEEINTAYPDMNLPENDILREPDGKVYAVPVRGYWEGLYVHTDLFEQYGAPLPKDWASLLEAIKIFRENGILPIAISLSDIPHYLAEMSLLACASKEDLAARPKTFEEVPASWLEAMSLIRELAEAGAFADKRDHQPVPGKEGGHADGRQLDSILLYVRDDGYPAGTAHAAAQWGRNGRLLCRRCFHGLLPDPPGLGVRTAGRGSGPAAGTDQRRKYRGAWQLYPFGEAAGFRKGYAGREADGQPAAGRHEHQGPGSLAAGMYSRGGGGNHDA